MTLAVVLSLALKSGVGASDPQPLLAPGAIVDVRRGVVYIGCPVGGVEAVDLRTGATRWATEAAALPLGLAAGRLLALGEENPPGPRLPIVVIDVEHEGRAVFAARLPLPEGVRAAASDDANSVFRAQAWPRGAAFALAWTYRERLARGMAPLDGESAPERQLAGGFRIDPASKKTETVDSASLEPPQATAQAWTVGGVRATTEGGRGSAITLKRWDARTDHPRPDVALSPNGLVSLPSVDGRHVLVIERVGRGGPDDPEYRWSIFAVETAERVGELRRDVSAMPFVVFDDRVVVASPPSGGERDGRWIEEPLALSGFAFGRHAPVWQHPIRDVEYRGPQPPRP
jgi:hypothetical protein